MKKWYNRQRMANIILLIFFMATGVTLVADNFLHEELLYIVNDSYRYTKEDETTLFNPPFLTFSLEGQLEDNNVENTDGKETDTSCNMLAYLIQHDSPFSNQVIFKADISLNGKFYFPKVPAGIAYKLIISNENSAINNIIDTGEALTLNNFLQSISSNQYEVIGILDNEINVLSKLDEKGAFSIMQLKQDMLGKTLELITKEKKKELEYKNSRKFISEASAISFAPDCPPANTSIPYIGGKVYRDVDFDGTFTASTDQAVSGVTVSVFSNTGLVGTTTSSNDGDYLFQNAAMTNGTEYRVEFTDYPSFLQPSSIGSTNNTSVQFVTPSVCDISFGLIDPDEYLETNPDLVIPCYVYGDNASSTNDALISFPANASTPNGGSSGSVNHEAQAGAIGTTYGVAYSKQSDLIFVSAYQRRFTGFSSTGKTGSIYSVTDPTDGTFSGTEFLDLNALFGSNVAGDDVHDFSPSGTGIGGLPADRDFFDNESFNATGRTSFGDLEITSSGDSLWVVNLNDRSLYGIPLGSDPQNPQAPTSASQIEVVDIVNNLPGIPAGVTTDELIPFALKYYQGQLYIGVVANGQTNPADAYDNSDMYGLAYRYNGSTFTKVLEFPLNYARGNGIYGDNATPFPQPADVNDDTYGCNWNPWLNANALPTPLGVPAIGADIFWDQGHPQPILSDIEFDAAGNMIIGLRDRYGDQQGYQSLNVGGQFTTDENGNPGSNQLHNFNDAFGDMLLATPNGTGWSVNIADFTDNTYSGTSGTDGVCSPGESFFGEDCFNSVDFGLETIHEEIFMGGLAIDPRTNTIITTSIDPTQNPFSNGVIRYDTETGARLNGFQILGIGDNFGKGNALGDIELVSDPAPIEIGNRLWEDEDLDGIQDPGEPGINGVLVELFIETTPGNFTKVAETTTGTSGTQGDGAYSFSMNGAAGQTWVNGATAVEPLSNYEIRVSLTNVQAANANIVGFTLSNQNSDTSNDAATDLNDADQIVNAGVASISYTTEDGGFNNHTLDFGAFRCVLIANAGADQSLCAGSSATLTASATQGIEPFTYNWDNGLGAGISQTVSPNTTTTYTVTVTDANGCMATDQVIVTVNPLPTVTLNDPADVCIDGSDMNFTATPAGGTFSTTAPSGFMPNNAAGTAVLDVSVAGAGTYDVTYSFTDGNGCMASQTVSVTVNPLPTVTLNDPADECIDGSDMNFTATPAGGTFSTTAPSGFTPNNAAGTAVLDVNAAGAGTYDVTYSFTDGNGCMASQTVSVTVNSLPTVTLNDPADECIDGSDMNFTATPAGGTFSTTAPSGFTPNNAAGTAVLDVSAAGAGTYNVTYDYTDGNGCMASQTVSVTVNPLPTVTLNDPADVCIDGSDMNFTATPAGGTFSTTAPSGFTPNNAAGTAVLDVSAAGAGTYDVTYSFTDGNGCMASQTVSVTVNPLPTVTLNDPADVCIDGSDMNFTATPAGGTFSTTAPSGFTPNNAAGTAVLDVSAAGAGTYDVTYSFTDGNGCMASQTVSVTVNPLPTVTLNDPTDVCIDGSDMNFTATPAGGTFSTTAPSGFTPNNAAGTAVLDVSAAGAGTYDVTYSFTDGNGCMASQTVSVTVNPLPTVTLNDPTDECIDGSDMNFTATPAGGTFSTTAPSGFTPNNAAGTAVLDVSAAGAGTYDVTYSFTDGNGCMASQTVSVTVNPLPTVTAAIINTNCYDPNSGSIDITASGGTAPYTYDWQDLAGTDNIEDRTGLAIGEYRVIVRDVNNCGSAELVINITSSTFPTCSTTSSLGSTVFTDLDNDGLFESGAGEIGIQNVVLNLDQVVGVSSGSLDINNDGNVDATDDGFLIGYPVIDGGIDYNGDGVVNAVDDGLITADDGAIYTVVDGALNGVGDGTLNIQVASTTTDANGNYFFDGLTPGDYQVEIPNSEFGAGEPLNVTSTSSIPTVTVDAGTSNIDNDDNGIQAGGSGTTTVSPVITLAVGEEPVNGGTEIGQGNDQDIAADADGDMTIDFGFFFLQMDYGDLADSGNGTGSGNYETQSANGGPSHIILPNIQLGASIDGESDGQQSPNADGDDNNGDDEDGVDLNGLNFQAGQTISIPVVVSNNTGSTANLYAFVDWNNDGDFGDTGEQVLVSVPSMAGTQTILIDFTIPTEVAGAAINTTVGARFRLTTDTLAGNAWEGAANNGEVEDYILTINCPTGNCLPVQISNN